MGQYAPVPKPELSPNERELETYRANRTQGSRAVGGHLLLTDQRLLFYPHKVDSATGGATEYFVVNNADAAVTAIEQAVAR